MISDLRIELLEHRVRELQTAVAAIIQHLGIEQQVTEVERAPLEEIRRVLAYLFRIQILL